MTGFAGLLVRDAAPAETADAIKARARAGLSRNPRHAVETEDRGRFFLAYYDNKAWDDNRALLRSAAGFAAVSGSPLVSGAGGVTSGPGRSAAAVAEALATSAYKTLAASAGCFAACHWDDGAGVLKLCADKLANRPLYVYQTPRLCLFSTTLRVLRTMLDAPLPLDEAGLAEFVFLGDALESRTVFQDVTLVPPGTVLEITAASSRAVPYFRWTAIPDCADPQDVMTARAHDLFMMAIRRRVGSGRQADAFLTGGMDSRSVVAGLLDAGVAVRGFNYSYPGSADDVLGKLAAEKLGVELVAKASRPEDRIKLDTDLFALNARDHFPPAASGEGARLIWSGDGGSVGLGHVYMTSDSVAALARDQSEATLLSLFPRLRRNVGRAVRRDVQEKLRALALAGLKSCLFNTAAARPDRRQFLFYLLNDQSRHLYPHFENIDLSDIEFETPFFDMDFLSYVVSTAIEPFLYHRLYNAWLARFGAPAASFPWQAYRGHEACPLPLPDGILNQWETDWYGGRVGAQAVDQALRAILKSRDARVWQVLDRPLLSALKLANRGGWHRFNYEGHFARQIFERITGTAVFADAGR